jgi:phosphoribosylformimino-5-aminoimidazole carboxamide ribotide isomerase
MVPSIDIKAGRCVGFVRESLATERVYASDPVAVAARWEAEGATWLHVVDIEAALCGTPIDWETLHHVIRAVRIPVQIGGRLRRAEDVRRAFALGARRVVMGAIEDAPSPDAALAEVIAAAREIPGGIVLALDVREARADPQRWSVLEALAREAAAHGVGWIGVADASRDGTLEGPNVEAVERLKSPGRARMMLSGGIGSTDDLLRLRGLESAGLAAVIVGRALYDGHISFRAARASLSGEGGVL